MVSLMLVVCCVVVAALVFGDNVALFPVVAA